MGITIFACLENGKKRKIYDNQMLLACLENGKLEIEYKIVA